MSRNKAIRNRLNELFLNTEALAPHQPEAAPLRESAPVGILPAAPPVERGLAQVLEIVQSVSSIADQRNLLDEAARLIAARFALYRVHIYLSDFSNRTLVWQAGAGAQPESGASEGSLFIRNLTIGSASLAGQAAASRQAMRSISPTVVPGPGGAPVETIELAVPLLTGKMLRGVLDLYSQRSDDFMPEQVLWYESLAAHLAMGIEIATLRAESQQALGEIDKSTRTQRQSEWVDFLNAVDRHERIGFSYELGHDANFIPLQQPLPPSNAQSTLETDLSIGGAVIGKIQIEMGDGDLAVGDLAVGDLAVDQVSWSTEDANLVQAIAQRVASHVDNLRLLAQAEHYRSEAEAAARRLTREGWDVYLQQQQTTTTDGYTYDLNQVIPLNGTALPVEQPLMEQTAADVLAQTLRVRDEEIGRVIIAGADDAESEEAVELISAVTERLSLHLESLRLLEETERSRQQLDRRATEMETVARVSTAAATILSPQDLLQSVVDLTKYSFNLYFANVFLLNESQDTLVLTAGAGKLGHRLLEEGLVILLDHPTSVVARSARQRVPLVINDTRLEANTLPHPLLPDTRSEIAVPLIVGDQLLGVFNAHADVAGRFSEDDLRIYTTLAAQVAVALRNAQLYAEQMSIVERLRELDHLKNSFLANMSHELRTPLNSILGFTQVILEGLDGPLTENMETDLNLVEKNGRHLLNLINDVLDMAKIEAGRLSLNFERFDLRELVQDVVDSSSSLVREKSLTLAVQINPQDDLTVTADRFRIRQILINLIGNSSKFTDSGGITVEVNRLPDKAQIRIRDTGIGIPPDKLENIFEAFSQVDTTTTRKVGGTGLGLPISRRLASLHNGRLWAESRGVEGEGSVFCLDLPVEPVDLVE